MELTYPGLAGLIILFLSIYVLVFIYEKKRNLLIWIFRIISISLVILLLFEVTFINYDNKSKLSIALLIDTSSSMKFNRRLSLIQDYIKKNLAEIQSQFNVTIYQFSSNTSIVPESELPKLSASGNQTDITNAVNNITNSETDKYDSVLLFSDGQHNANSNPGQLTQALNTPVYAVYPDEKNTVTDISITDIRCSDYILKNVPTEISVMIFASNLTNREITLYLKKDREIITTKKSVITKSGFNQVDFEFTSQKLGIETYSIEIPPLPEETVTANNTRFFKIETIREKLRIIHICGQPNSEYYFLRYFFKSNPVIELVSFVILRNPENVEVVPDEQLSLIPFPVNEIFTKDIFDYDIAVFENFNFYKFGVYPYYLENVKRYVKEKGGGLLIIGGENSFGNGGYKGSPIDEVIPAELNEYNEPVKESLFRLNVTNYTHPIMQLSNDAAESEKIWNTLIPELEGFNQLRQKPGTTVLAVHPTDKNENGNTVILSCGEYGKGRSVAIATNSTWRIALNAESIAGKKYYTRFWTNVIQWLTKSEDTKTFRISITQKKYIPHEKIEIKLIAIDAALRNSKPKLFVTDPMLRTSQIIELAETNSGWKTYYTPEITGKYSFAARLEKNDKITNTDNYILFIEPEINREELQLSVNTELLDKLSALTGGESCSLSEFNPQKIRNNIMKKSKPVIKKQINTRKLTFIYFIIIILLIIEWFLRRIKGLL